MGNYIFSLQPTFTQGFILGQLSILFLLALILKYLFWSSGPEPLLVSLPPRTEQQGLAVRSEGELDPEGSVEWFNTLTQQIAQSYRNQLREHISGSEGDECVRKKIETKVNEARPTGFMDYVKIHSVDLGKSAPRLSQPRKKLSSTATRESMTSFEATYNDTISISLSTSILLHYPRPYFARLPISLTLSLDVFSSNLLLVHPDPNSEHPTMRVSLSPDFTLKLKINSLIGSRAKLADVPKLHEMIESQIRHFLIQRATWTLGLPSLQKDDLPSKNS